MRIDVVADAPGAPRGWCVWKDGCAPCALGRAGILRDKREGDGATPAGLWPVRRVLYRADRLNPPPLAMPASAIRWRDGWSDDPRDPNYNRAVRLPRRFGHERLWRADRLYDLVLVLGYNDSPPVPGKGSAIFLHQAREDFAPTEGCVALAQGALLGLVGALDARSFVRVRFGRGV